MRIAPPTRAMLDVVPRLAKKRIILASGSPRRKELLDQIGMKYAVMVSKFDETLPKDGLSGAEYAEKTAWCKAFDVASQLEGEADTVIIGADTVVEIEGLILEKPDDSDHARRMMNMLSGSTHAVHTGVALVVPGTSPAFVRSFSVTTAVTFSALSPQDIDEYIASGEPFGKAGSYGIQGKAAAFVSGINGCYFNVVGLPLHDLCRNLGALVDSGKL